jgi:hypothetical protein
MGKTESELNLTTLAILLCVGTLGGGILMANLLRPDDVKFVMDKDNHCKLVDKVETDKRLYCGKACTTPEYKQTFQCADGKTRIVFYYELH